MFLSRVEIPWESARNPYNLHRRVWDLFPDVDRETRKDGEQPRQGFLFKVEHYAPGRSARLLVQSRRSPQAMAGVTLLGSKEFQPQPVAGQRLGFLLTANPIKTVNDVEREAKSGKRSEKCRVPLIKEEDQRAWITRKLAGAATIETVGILPNSPLYFRKGNHGGKLVTVTFEGVFSVLDAEALIRLLENGVGPAKGFGCGLLLVRRI